jgi:zinc transport system permease protein
MHSFTAMITELFYYDFMVHALVAGTLVALIAPLIGIFLVLRRYSLIADSLAHVSLAGVAAALLFGWNPIVTALATTIGASLGIEKLRASKRVYGDSALAIFLSGALALAVVLISLGHGFSTNIFNYLFGSIITVSTADMFTIALLALMVGITIFLFYKELLFIAFDEESAHVSGIPVKKINALLITAAAVTIALAIPIVGVLLISALMVIPVVTALQWQKSFLTTIIIAEVISLCAVWSGIIASFYLDLSTGGTIVLTMIGIFLLTIAFKK